jgi:hypothetical protein
MPGLCSGTVRVSGGGTEWHENNRSKWASKGNSGSAEKQSTEEIILLWYTEWGQRNCKFQDISKFNVMIHSKFYICSPTEKGADHLKIPVELHEYVVVNCARRNSTDAYLYHIHCYLTHNWPTDFHLTNTAPCINKIIKSQKNRSGVNLLYDRGSLP